MGLPGLPRENVMTTVRSPTRRNTCKLSLRFFQKKRMTRACDVCRPAVDELETTDREEAEASGSDEVVDEVVPNPSPRLASLIPRIPCQRRVPFVGLNNLGNTCYLNSVLQVLYYCPGLREGIKKLYSLSKKDKPKEDAKSKKEDTVPVSSCVPACTELLRSFYSLITSVEQLQSSFLWNPDHFSERVLAMAPWKVLHTLRQLNSMYEGHLQHDAQEVLQCILGYIKDACDAIKKEHLPERYDAMAGKKKECSVNLCLSTTARESKKMREENHQGNGKRESDVEAGNAKKKPKSSKFRNLNVEEANVDENKPLNCAKRKASEMSMEILKSKMNEVGTKTMVGNGGEEKDVQDSVEVDERRRETAQLGPSVKQPSIFRFCSTGKNIVRPKQDGRLMEDHRHSEKSHIPSLQNTTGHHEAKTQESLELLEHLFHGRLVLRTRCLECENITERSEDFYDISIPVQEDQTYVANICNISPDPKPEHKTLQWAIAQFASVERIVGGDKYFCETCHHYTEAERSLLFDKTPEIITIHLKRFTASSSQLDSFVGLSKVNTPLQTPLTLSLEPWCTDKSSGGQHYDLFAVVMHSGVTINNGHYTTYIHMSGLEDVKFETSEENEGMKIDAEITARAEHTSDKLEYYCGGLLFNLKGGQRGERGLIEESNYSSIATTGDKNLSESGVGPLGLQNCTSEYDLTKQTQETSRSSNGCEQTRTNYNTKPTNKTDIAKRTVTGDEARRGRETMEQQALLSLLEYEGKWLLFDDSEVQMFEEEDFLRVCSSQMGSSSTPYMLFYNRSKPEC